MASKSRKVIMYDPFGPWAVRYEEFMPYNTAGIKLGIHKKEIRIIKLPLN